MAKGKHNRNGGYLWSAWEEERRSIQRRNEEIREKIISAAQKDPPEIDIPPISRPWLEVIDPFEIDETLLGLIEKGDLEFTDELFFECLSDSAKYLVYYPFQERIAKWQSMIHDEFLSQEEKREAQEKLKKIGTTLAFVGSGRLRDTRKEMEIYLHFKELEQMLEPVMKKISGLSSPGNRVLTFKEKCPALGKYANKARFSKTAHGMAKEIIQGEYGIKERTLENILREHDEMIRTTKVIRKENAIY